MRRFVSIVLKPVRSREHRLLDDRQLRVDRVRIAASAAPTWWSNAVRPAGPQ